MRELPGDLPAAKRAQWLAELSEALRQVGELLVQLNLTDEQLTTARELKWQIEAARLEVRSLSLGRPHVQRDEFEPEWTGPLTWPGNSRKT